MSTCAWADRSLVVIALAWLHGVCIVISSAATGGRGETLPLLTVPRTLAVSMASDACLAAEDSDPGAEARDG